MNRPEPRFAGRTALVTGASRGIGLAVAQRLVAEGARVVVTGRKPGPLAEAVAQLGGPEHAVGVAGDTADDEHRAAAVARAVETFDSLDLLVNSAGINPVFGPLVDLDLAAARTTVEANVLAALSWVQHAHRAWLGEHGGAVVNLSSIGAFAPSAGLGAYSASKLMLVHLTRTLALELGPGVRVNAVAPALVKTRFSTAIYAGREAEATADYPLGRLGTPEDVAAAVAFVLSDDAGWITGQTLLLDGGLTLH
ncbi:SDR family oxidoreductase [Pseudonocardia alni]|uniref:SDR family oxidoreductase n=1 Tax=Pseudonocardia TaxID=1847 RepID=UPI0020969F4A|nr:MULTISPECIES: SDR family oxidoreductase [Pseudonocardia]MCO7192049.1 SDR family oxidoreductase [Pseudonocardia sp. McavD-2-B]WFG47239.1 SDR family oxidoreductase [Pseudonocardia alni]